MRYARIVVAVAAVTVLSASLFASGRRHAVHMGSGDWSCSPTHVTFSDVDTWVSEESFDVSGASPLEVEAAHNGGIHVSGTSASSFRVSVCRAVGALDQTEANELLQGIRVVRDGGRLSIDGPAVGRWVAHFRIEAPRGAKLDLSATNGPIGIEDIEDADLTIETKNGPISLDAVRGHVRARAQNGPISLVRGSGEMDLEADNGPIAVEIGDDGWSGEGLDARTRNGPLTVRLPSDVTTGVLVESDGRSPIECDPGICDDARTRWTRGSVRFELGAGPPVIRMSTQNGPLTIRER